MSDLRWLVRRPDDLSWRDWDGLGAVHDDGSGDTHLIDALGLEILMLLMARGLSLADLVDQLADAMPDGMTTSTASAFIERQLHGLQDLGLIESAAAQA